VRDISISLHKVTSSIDEEAIVSRKKVNFYAWMNEKDLLLCLFEQMPSLMDDLAQYLAGELEPIPNTSDSYYPPFDVDSITLHEEMSACEMLNLSRSQKCYGGVRLKYGEG
jgi:methionyl-tRNA formyltransferase